MLRIIALIIIFILFSMCLDNHKSGESMEKGKILMVIAPKDFRDEELFIPMEVFKEHGYGVDVVSTQKGTCVGMLGGKIEVDKTIYEINPNDYIAIVIPGGIGSKEYLWNNEKLLELVREFYRENKTVAAICLSPVVLARAGVLKDKKATVFPTKEAIEELKKYGAEYVDEGVVIDGKIVTGKSPEYAKDFALAIIKTLG
ncbi:Pfpi family intracellular protease [Methanocaldococcus villosus KIN24-T80]|uniref:Pfpi family intracellular protease n=1 Tax=Methanocaldococcus villosus KIN24-T80 TaxID=1069083 RepID=N6VZI5_9EURY|nr:DJ-1/PfpI/YhbO family deglycase/protease [Methanocaldococcus villosus]ENN96522.1 Pfpi family intracellular protease [Methanocaldococcus villosus KIN24-T80]